MSLAIIIEKDKRGKWLKVQFVVLRNSSSCKTQVVVKPAFYNRKTGFANLKTGFAHRKTDFANV